MSPMTHSFGLPVELGRRVLAFASSCGAEPAQVLSAAFLAVLGGSGPLAPGVATLATTAGTRTARVPGPTETMRDLVARVGGPGSPPEPAARTARFECPPVPAAAAGTGRTGERPSGDARPELQLAVRPAGDGSAHCQWSLSGQWANRLLAEVLEDYFLRTLAGAMAAADRPVAGLVCPDQAQLDWLYRHGRPPDRYPVTSLAHQLIEAQARLRPQAVALVRGRDRLTYRDLNVRANQLARSLRALGAGRDRTVALLMGRSTELLVAFLAVFKTGAAAVLLDPAHPPRRRDRALRLARPCALLTLAELGLAAPQAPVPVVAVDTEWPRIHTQDPGDLAVAVHPDDVAYVVHTSGSTGEPKRVAVVHRSVSHATATHRDGHRITPGDRAAWLSPPGSSVSVGELWPYLATGASIHIADPLVVASPVELRDWLVEERITKAFASMPLAEHLVGLPWPEQTALQLLTVGSDRVHRWPDRSLPFEVAVSYGSSEANGISSCLVPWSQRLTSTTATDTDRAAAPPVGRPWPGVRVHLLDHHLRPVPPGAVGELHVGGPELARGYLGDPAQTAARFLPDPFGTGERLYRTGDLARIDERGFLHHQGRVDHETKINGFRVDLGEVEAALLEQPGVVGAVVVAREDFPDQVRRLCAYLVAASQPDPAALRDTLAAQLPAHAVPAAVTFLDALPVTTNGKVDRRALPAPDRGALGGPGEPPRDQTEQQLVQLWCEVLGLERVGVDSHFFECGGDSLAAGRLVARISRRLRVRVTLRVLLAHPTPRQLADRIRAQLPSRPVPISRFSSPAGSTSSARVSSSSSR